MRAAILGVGWSGEMHARSLRAEGIEIAAVVSSNGERAAEFARKWGIPRSGTDRSLLWGEDVDCVHVCTPPGSHFELIRELLAHGKHVLCEKPLCLDDGEAAALAGLAENSGLVCAVGFNVRAYLACRKARELVAAPEFGRVLLVHGSYLQEYGVSPVSWDWRRRAKMYAVTEIGSHWLDLARYVTGQRITAVSARLDRFHQTRWEKDGSIFNEFVEGAQPVAVAPEDIALLSLNFENGAMGNVVLSEASHGRGNRLSMEVVGERQTLWWMSEEPGKLYLGSGKFGQPVCYEFEDEFSHTFRRVIADVYAAIEGQGTGICTDFDQARDNVLLCSAAWRSAEENGTWVEV